ncbi:MAG: hypothetical protein LBS64_06560 [Spirochaetaceae bacterium]|jgi:hypothetical protein|nr:hypothetical protein [Spirochaetaceae bacterium]
MKRFVKLLFCTLWGLFIFAPLRPEIFSSPLGFSFDLPAGFVETARFEDDSGASFINTVLPVQFILRIYDGDSTPRQRLEETLHKLGGDGDLGVFEWNGSGCVISSFSLQNSEMSASGWAFAAVLPDSQVLIALTYADNRIAGRSPELYEFFMLSVMDSFATDADSRFDSGPVMTFAFPRGIKRQLSLNMAGQTLTVPLDTSDVPGAQFVIDREFAVLKEYAQSPLKQEAWQRYYRQIYRDSCARLEEASLAILDVLDAGEEETLRSLLAWTQAFPYARNFGNAASPRPDFTPLPAILMGAGSDCDSRAMLLAAVMHHMGSKTALFISETHRHALFGIQLDLGGAKIQTGQGVYLLNETTVSVDPGLVSRDMSNTDAWFPVILPHREK